MTGNDALIMMGMYGNLIAVYCDAVTFTARNDYDDCRYNSVYERTIGVPLNNSMKYEPSPTSYNHQQTHTSITIERLFLQLQGHR